MNLAFSGENRLLGIWLLWLYKEIRNTPGEERRARILKSRGWEWA